MSSLVVDTNLTALATLNSLNSTSTAETKAIGELSTGLAIQSAATGPAQYVISQALQSQSNGDSTAIANAQNGVSLIQTVGGALTQISSILQTMDQLATSNANTATATTTALAANTAEFQDLAKTITQIAKTTTFGSKQLLTGTFSGTLQVGAFNTSNDQVKLAINGMTLTTLGLATTTTGTLATIKITGGTAATGTTPAVTNAAAAIATVQAAISKVDTAASTVGATQDQLHSLVANLTVAQQNIAAANSQLVDVNMAAAMTTYSTDQILMQTGVAMLAQAQQSPSLVLKLVG